MNAVSPVLHPLTPRQKTVLRALASYLAVYQRAPSMVELAFRSGFTSKSASRHFIDQLQIKGYVRTFGGRLDSIEILAMPEEEPPVPEVVEVPRNKVLAELLRARAMREDLSIEERMRAHQAALRVEERSDLEVGGTNGTEGLPSRSVEPSGEYA